MSTIVPGAGWPVAEGEYESHWLEKRDLLICCPQLPTLSERKTGSSPKDYQLCTVLLFLLVQDIPSFAPATSSLAGLPADHGAVTSLSIVRRFILSHSPVIYWHIFNANLIIVNLSSSKSSSPRPPGAPWLSAEEEGKPKSPTEWTSDYKYYSGYTRLLLVRPH